MRQRKYHIRLGIVLIMCIIPYTFVIDYMALNASGDCCGELTLFMHLASGIRNLFVG